MSNLSRVSDEGKIVTDALRAYHYEALREASEPASDATVDVDLDRESPSVAPAQVTCGLACAMRTVDWLRGAVRQELSEIAAYEWTVARWRFTKLRARSSRRAPRRAAKRSALRSAASSGADGPPAADPPKRGAWPCVATDGGGR